ncbi:DUF6443 domain-containing protein [Pedobacter nutrimenti]|uniref:RHS repeat-associated protein n=1 Tax=Pedobacter nutrimenti TaxID=1241337 RepID=A0A318UCX7_9SPHI|nr:DUF6443 domain-containing protein [Pedobacter nutrimenti]PYF74244.1 RHS repeat-associated protein [Pedobacter nutrimenti]
MKYKLKNISKSLVVGLVVSGFYLKANAQHITRNSYNNESVIQATGSVTLTDGFYIPVGKTVRIFTAVSFANCVDQINNPSANQNYISTRIFKVRGVKPQNIDSLRKTCEVNQTIQYFDGLGRPLQSVTVQGSPTFKDIVQPIAYDAFGRENKKYLPYPVAGNNGNFKSDALTAQNAFYSNPFGAVTKIENSAFSESRFEASPLNRTEEQGSPGASWQMGSGHTVRLSYGSNNSSTAYASDGFAVRLYNAEAAGGYQRTLTGTGFYEANQLYLIISKDENWTAADGKAGTIEEYKDKEGRVILKRVFNQKDGTIETLSTYYIYDDLGNLSFVLPPGVNPDATAIPDQNNLNSFCYQYRYDGRKRLIEKRIPGKKDWENMVYNSLGQLVLSQDPNQKKSGQWLFTKYDALGRVTMTGLYNNVQNRAEVQNLVDAPTSILWEKWNKDSKSWSNDAFPQSIAEQYTLNYYDDYSFTLPSAYVMSGASAKTKGLLTGSATKVLGTGDMLLSVNYYDEEARVVKIYKQHYLSGTANEANYDEIENAYNFPGELIASNRIHHVGANQTTIANRYEYDHVGRKKASFESINGATEVVLSKLDYNELGQLVKKSLHSEGGTNFIQNSSYAYNERGWMSRINKLDSINASTVFGMELLYGNTPGSFNGNIGAINWKTKVPAGLGLSEQVQNYAYSYDKLNRLLKADYVTPGAAGKFNEEMSYDVMGNILNLKRTNSMANYLNNFSYNYTSNGIKGNQLYDVSDTGIDGKSSTYAYDDNGNQKTDSRKGINISYNMLNLPKTITKSSTGESLNYVYDATGQKLKKIYGSNTRDYIGGIEYNNGAIEFIQTEEGRALPGSSYSYEYMLKDHLGNTRATIKQNGEIVQVQDYYAFGLEMNPGNNISPSPQNNYTYNGKEKQGELGLSQLDYGARFYDPLIGRWNVVDPLSEKFFPLSAYSYTADNPVLLNDPNGKDWTITMVIDKNGIAHYQILFTAAVVDNTSKKNGRPNELAKAVKKQFEKIFNVNEKKVENGTLGFTVEAKAEINVYDDAQSIGYKETLIEIKDRTDDDFKSTGSNIVGYAPDGKHISINEKYVDDMISGRNQKTLAHEIGHTGGLKHPAMDNIWFFPGPTYHLKDTNNFMIQGKKPDPTGPTRDQMYRIYRLYRSGKLNNRDIYPVDQ